MLIEEFGLTIDEFLRGQSVEMENVELRISKSSIDSSCVSSSREYRVGYM